MDAAEADLDVKLQKISADLIGTFDSALPTFLRKPDGHGGSHIRSWVRASEVWRLTNTILDQFQELPQLLDPQLPKWIPLLSQAYLDHLLTRRRGKRTSMRSKLLMSLDQAICKVLYTFCKIRGEKVIVRFLNVETKYLELLLSAIEDSEQRPKDEEESAAWAWEQRYIVILWLSHLLLAPFDLSTISSVDLDDVSLPTIPGLLWPSHLPGITMRVVPLAIRYLATPGRERDAAKALLVRTAMRRDMQQLGVLDSLVQWALFSLRPREDKPVETIHFYLGILSFLAGVLRSSSDTSDMDKYLSVIFHTVHGISIDGSELSKSIVSFALARKLILKVLRTVTVSLQRQTPQDMASTELTETAIGYMLDSVGDNDTPVRLAASKSLSIITLKLDPEMASQVVEAVLEALNRNVLWHKSSSTTGAPPVRDLSAVDNLEWHGLMLTLSHLLYRRSPPAEKLSDIVHALLLGLAFEQRGTSGASVGANVRDAACFGIWGLARRYSTKELLAVARQPVLAAKAHPASSSILQVLGTELVTTASLDPSGNIRRGASAALQELIGRHPDTVERGIEVVQTVDYHAVARRSRAIKEVALNATKLSSQYGEAIVDGLLGWRGIGDMNASSRRVTGAAFGDLMAELAKSAPEGPLSRFEASVTLVTDRLRTLEKRQVEERHGLLTCFAFVLDKFPELVCKAEETGGLEGAATSSLVSKILKTVRGILEVCSATTYRRPEDIAEAASRLVVSSVPLLQAAALPEDALHTLETGQQLLSPTRSDVCLELVSSLDSMGVTNTQVSQFTSALSTVIPQWLGRNEEEAIEQASAAALTLLVFSSREDRAKTLQGWATTVGQKPSIRTSVYGDGHFATLARAQPLAGDVSGDDADIVCAALLQRWQAGSEVDTRVAILQSLTRSRLLRDKPMTFLGLLAEGLDDYTTTARGDVGSHVRVQALRAVKDLWQNLRSAPQMDPWVEASLKTLFLSTLRLSVEKLDRVRPEAQAAMALTMRDSHAEEFRFLPFSSKLYLQTLLQLLSSDHLDPRVSQAVSSDPGSWMAALLAGFVTSADTGNEDLVIASRAALCDFCESSADNLALVCEALLQNLKTQQGQDRVVVPTLETMAFLFHVGLFQPPGGLRGVCQQTQKAGYKTGNVRKILACVKVYGGVARTATGDDGAGDSVGAVQEARRRLGALLFHPWPRVRSGVVDELWGLVGDGNGESLTGVDWATADKGQIRAVVEELRLV